MRESPGTTEPGMPNASRPLACEKASELEAYKNKHTCNIRGNGWKK